MKKRQVRLWFLALVAVLIAGCASIPSPDREEAPAQWRPPTATRVQPYQNAHPPVRPTQPAPPKTQPPLRPVPPQPPANGAVVNVSDMAFEFHIFPGIIGTLFGPQGFGDLVFVGDLNARVVMRKAPIAQGRIGSPSVLVLQMGGKVTGVPFYLPRGEYTALYCPFRCSRVELLRLTHFRSDPDHPQAYQPYPHAPILHQELVWTHWLLLLREPSPPRLTLDQFLRVRINLDFRALNPLYCC